MFASVRSLSTAQFLSISVIFWISVLSSFSFHLFNTFIICRLFCAGILVKKHMRFHI